jgi:hypothetical protein
MSAYRAEIARSKERGPSPDLARPWHRSCSLGGVRTMPISPELIAAVVFAVAAAWALARASRAQIEVITISVSDSWALDHHCRAILYLLTEAPGLQRVEIDLGDFFVADSSTISLLTYTRGRVEGAGVTLSIVANPAIGRLLVASGLPASPRGAVEEPVARRATAN